MRYVRFRPAAAAAVTASLVSLPTAVPALAGTVGTGKLEVCALADNGNGRVTGTFEFHFAGRTATLPVGTCTGPLSVPAGTVVVTENRRADTAISHCGTSPMARLQLCDPGNSSASVRVVAGGVANETLLGITNRVRTVDPVPSGTVKICKIAGNGVTVGTEFTFAVGGRTLTVPAGPASNGGYCKIAGRWHQGTKLTVTEGASGTVYVSDIAVAPLARQVSSDVNARTTTVKVGSGFTVATFTNADGCLTAPGARC